MTLASSKNREDSLNRYITTQNRSHELIGVLGLRNDCETPGKARPEFTSPTVRSLYDKTEELVNRLSEKSLEGLREKAKRTDFLQEDLDRILRQHGAKIWGRDERSHLHDRDASQSLFCQQNLHWDQADHRETIKLYVLCWVLNRAATKNPKIDSPFSSAISPNFPNIPSSPPYVTRTANFDSDSDSDSIGGLDFTPLKTPATMLKAPVAPMFRAPHNLVDTLERDPETPSRLPKPAGKAAGMEPLSTSKGQNHSRSVMEDEFRTPSKPQSKPGTTVRKELTTSSKAQNYFGTISRKQPITPSKAQNHPETNFRKVSAISPKLQNPSARPIGRAQVPPAKPKKTGQGKNLRRRDSMGYKFVSSDSQFPPEQDHESDSTYVDDDDSSQETSETKRRKRVREDTDGNTPGKLRKVNKNIHTLEEFLSPPNPSSAESVELPLRNSFVAVGPVVQSHTRQDEGGDMGQQVIDVDEMEVDMTSKSPPIQIQPDACTARSPSIELGGFVPPDIEESFNSLFDDRSPTIGPITATDMLRRLRREPTPCEALDWTTIQETQQLGGLNMEDKKIRLLFLLIHRLHNCRTFAKPDENAEKQLDMLLDHINSQEHANIQRSLGTDFERLQCVYNRWRDMRAKICSLQHAVQFFSGPGQNFTQWKEHVSRIEDNELAVDAMEQLFELKNWASSMKRRDRWFDKGSFDEDLARYLEPMVDTYLCYPKGRLVGGKYNQELLVWFE